MSDLSKEEIAREIVVPEKSTMSVDDYKEFLHKSYSLMKKYPFFAPDEGIDSLELAHLIPEIPETVIAIYVGINDAACNKGLVSPILIRHGHNSVFVFDNEIYSGGDDVPDGTIDAKIILKGFEPPNNTWDSNWTYVMVQDAGRGHESLWNEKGYIDMIAAKFEDFMMLSDPGPSKLCIFIDPGAFDHPANKARSYLKEARQRGDAACGGYEFPKGMEDEGDGLAPVILNKGERLYVARVDSGPCAHAWSTLHPDNRELAVVEENSAVPLDLIIRKPVVAGKYGSKLKPALGSADMTTDWFFRSDKTFRKPLLMGLVEG